MKGVFITGADTEVGKTRFSSALIRSLRKTIAIVGAYKPVASGVANEKDSDAFQLWQATGAIQTLGLVCPQSFKAPLAPPLAASWEGKSVDQDLLLSGARAWEGRCDFLVVEGAGGLLSPLTFETSNADLAARFGWPIMVVVADRLGAVNQALMAFEVASARKLEVAAIVLNEVSEQAVSRTERHHASMIRQQLLATDRVTPPIIEFSYGQSELNEPDILSYFGNRR